MPLASLGRRRCFTHAVLAGRAWALTLAYAFSQCDEYKNTEGAWLCLEIETWLADEFRAQRRRMSCR